MVWNILGILQRFLIKKLLQKQNIAQIVNKNWTKNNADENSDGNRDGKMDAYNAIENSSYRGLQSSEQELLYFDH